MARLSFGCECTHNHRCCLRYRVASTVLTASLFSTSSVDSGATHLPAPLAGDPMTVARSRRTRRHPRSRSRPWRPTGWWLVPARFDCLRLLLARDGHLRRVSVPWNWPRIDDANRSNPISPHAFDGFESSRDRDGSARRKPGFPRVGGLCLTRAEGVVSCSNRSLTEAPPHHLQRLAARPCSRSIQVLGSLAPCRALLPRSSGRYACSQSTLVWQLRGMLRGG